MKPYSGRKAKSRSFPRNPYLTDFNKSKETAIATINKASSQRTLQTVGEESKQQITTEHTTPREKYLVPAHQKSTSTRV